MLRPLKVEIEAVAARLQAGAEDPMALAYDVIQLVEQLRGERETFTLALQLSPGVFMGYGPYATKAAAMKALPKHPMAQIAKGGVVIPTRGVIFGEAADSAVPERGDFALVREDAALFKRGWRGNTRDRSDYITT